VRLNFFYRDEEQQEDFMAYILIRESSRALATEKSVAMLKQQENQ
jgi:hypothetical protein